MIGTTTHGIIGFLRILQENEDNFASIHENYIEFDTEKLRNFDKYYFTYFFNKFNIAKSIIERTKNQFEYLENNLEKKLENKEEEKARKEKIKKYKKQIKDIIKKQLDKIKKIDEQIYNKTKEKYGQIDKEKTTDGIKEIKITLLENIQNEKINKKITLNLFKNILSTTYYGQPSFINVTKTALTYEEQQEIMYKDYISNIVETGFLHDILTEQYNIEQIKKYIENAIKNGRITKAMGKVYLKIQKEYIEKTKK